MRRVRLCLLGFLVAVMTAGCSGVEMKPGDRARNNRDVPQGPGVLTGSDGEFVIFRVDKKAEEKDASEGDSAD